MQAIVAEEMTQTGNRCWKARSKKIANPAKPQLIDRSIPADESTGKVFRLRPSAAKAMVKSNHPSRSNHSPPEGTLREDGAVFTCQSQAALAKKIKAQTMPITPRGRGRAVSPDAATMVPK
jgi:hypothetical protein